MADIAVADTVAADIDSNAEVSAHPFIISFFNLADNSDKKSTRGDAYPTAR